MLKIRSYHTREIKRDVLGGMFHTVGGGEGFSEE